MKVPAVMLSFLSSTDGITQPSTTLSQKHDIEVINKTLRLCNKNSIPIPTFYQTSTEHSIQNTL